MIETHMLFTIALWAAIALALGAAIMFVGKEIIDERRKKPDDDA